MNNNLKNKHLKLIFCFVLIVQGISFGFSQNVSFEASSESKLTITGTSSLHDWQMEAAIENCKIEIANYEEQTDLNIIDIVFQIPVVQLKSEHKKMDALAQKALKSDSFPIIRFQSDNLQPIFLGDNSTPSSVIGVLEIAGVAKEIELSVLSEKDSSSRLKFQFSVPINMVDHGVKPPSFMFGTFTTGSEVLVSFELYLNKLKQL
jgi:polyisoprenoid-binding protein YceI